MRLYGNIEMRACNCLNALYLILLKLELVYFWMFVIWYYSNESFMCLDAFYM